MFISAYLCIPFNTYSNNYNRNVIIDFWLGNFFDLKAKET